MTTTTTERAAVEAPGFKPVASIDTGVSKKTLAHAEPKVHTETGEAQQTS